MVEEYIKLREHCSWERESWNFYIPLRGNEVAIRELIDATVEMDCRQYKLLQLPMDAATVARSLAKNHCGYLHTHNKLEGRLDIRAVRRAARLLAEDARLAAEKPNACRWVDDDLYKGGIMKMMRPWNRRPARSIWPTAEILAKLRATPIKDLKVSKNTRHHWQVSTCDAKERLLEAGFKTAGEVADLTRTQILALPGVGTMTYHMVRIMLKYQLELDLAESVRERKKREKSEAEEDAKIASSPPPEPQMTEQQYLNQYR